MSEQRPRPSQRILRAAWIMARAFTPHRSVAVIALPWTLLAVLPATIRRGLFLDATRTGMVLLTPLSLTRDLLILLPIMMSAPMIALGAFMVGDLLGIFPVLLGLVALLVAVGSVGGLFLLPRPGTSSVPFGPETPPGPRWEIAALAQLPGTRFTAVQTARRVLATVPPAGAVIVASANTPALFRHYQRFGFTGGPKRRVHRVIT